VPVFYVLVQGEPLNSRPQNLVPGNLKRRYIVRCKKYDILNRLSVTRKFYVEETDRLTGVLADAALLLRCADKMSLKKRDSFCVATIFRE